MSSHDEHTPNERPSTSGKASFSVVRGGKAQPQQNARGHGSYEADAQALADMWDPRKRAEREERAVREAAEAANRAAREAAEAQEHAVREATEVKQRAARDEARRQAREGLSRVPDVNPQLQSRRQRRMPLADFAALEAANEAAANEAAANEAVASEVAARKAATNEVAASEATASEAVANKVVASEVVPVPESAPVRKPVVAEKTAAAQSGLAADAAALREAMPTDADIPLWDAGVPQDAFAAGQAAPADQGAEGELDAGGGQDENASQGEADDSGAPIGPDEDVAAGRTGAKPSRRKAASAPDAEKPKGGLRRHFTVGRVIGLVVIVVVLICACIAGYLCMLRWSLVDDAADLQGSWHLSGQPASVTITSDKMDLAGEVSYDYTLDTQAKVIYESLGTMTGASRYRFSADRNSVALLDDGSADWWANAMDDLDWYKDCVIAQITGGATPDLLHGESGVVMYRQGYDAAGVSVASTTTQSASSNTAASAGEGAAAADEASASTDATGASTDAASDEAQSGSAAVAG